MIGSQRKLQAVREGAELRAALATAFASTTPHGFDNVLLNRLLEYAKLPRDHPKKDPLELKQTLAAVDPGLGKLTLKQRKAMTLALENQLEQAKRFDLPDFFFVEGGWPPKEPEPEPPRAAAPKGSAQAVVVSATPRSGDGDGFTWTQTEAELTITIDVPPGTQQQEIMMQLAPKIGPAQQIAVRARFWPLPLISGRLHDAVEASEAMWHLEANSKVVIDLPKVEERLWPGTPPVFTSGPGPLAEFEMPPALPAPPSASAPADEADEATGAAGGGAAGGGAVVVGGAAVAPEGIVQKMGQRPNDLPTQLRGCALLTALVAADAGKALGAAQARALPVLVRALRLFGHHADLQLAAWPCLVHLIEAQPFLRKALADLDALRLVLSAIDAHKGDEGVLTQLAIATRLLLPATPPRAFVEAGGLELLVEAIAHHSSCLVLAEVAGGCLLKLAGVNNIVRRMLLRMEVLPILLNLCGEHEQRLPLHALALALAAELSRGDTACGQLLSLQISPAALVPMLGRFRAAEAVQADGARALAPLLQTEASALAFVAAGGVDTLLASVDAHGENSSAGEEAANALEGALVALCEAAGEEPPDDDVEAAELAELLRQMANDANERKRLEQLKREEAQEAARKKAAEEKAQAEEEAAGAAAAAAAAPAPRYSNFSWGASSFDDPRLAVGLEDATDEPRIVELDDD